MRYNDVLARLNSEIKQKVKELQCFSKFFDGEFAAFFTKQIQVSAKTMQRHPGRFFFNNPA